MKRIILLSFLLVVLVAVSFGQNPKIIAHRGYSHKAPENTLASFQKAIEVNADYFELDVQLSKDDSLMIMHDGTVDRTTDGTGGISDLTWQQLKELDAGSWFSEEFAGERIPTLSEALVLAKNSANNIGVIVEIKSSNTSVPKKIVELVKKLGMENRVVVSGFSLSQITLIKNEDPSIPVQLFATVNKSHIDNIAAIKGEWVGSGGNITKDLIDYAHSKGVKFNAWTINSASQMIALKEIGIDAITTDYPAVLMAAMDDTAPSDVVLNSATATEMDVTLNWEAAEDSESGIVGYDIFRDETSGATTLVASVKNVTTYVDKTYKELQQYYYRIKAKNAAGLTSVHYSNEISVKTKSDLTSPAVKYVTSKGNSSTVIIEFSERVDKTTAENISNYSFYNEATVLDAKLAVDLKTVILSTSSLSEQSYSLTIENVKDRADVPNVMQAVTVALSHRGFHSNEIAGFSLDLITDENLVIDETENLNDGVAKNGVFLTEGILGNALGFDGENDYVQFNSSSSFDINNNAVTVSLWTKLAYLPTELPVAFGPLFDSDGDQYVLYEDRGNSELRFKVSTSNGAQRPGIPNDDLTTGEWIHVVGVYDGTNAMIYLNGEKKDSHPLTGNVKPGQKAFLGKNGTSYFKGSIDQVEVFNTALSGTEIEDMYNNIKDIVITTSVKDVSESSIIRVYPNPNRGTFTIDANTSLNQYTKFEVVNLTGQVIYKGVLNTLRKQVIVLPKPVPGIYTVKVYSQTEKQESRMIIF